MRNRSMTRVLALGLTFGLAACMDLDVSEREQSGSGARPGRSGLD